MQNPKYQKVKVYYDKGLWDIGRVRDAVAHHWISEAEYIVITGASYSAESEAPE